ncbi:MAG: CvpA family protein [Bacillota bacterium]|nr:CvpA family protein [Bacillota bacterium]
MWTDIIILVFMAVCIIDGYKDGLMKSLAYLAGWIAAVTAAYFLWERVKQFLIETAGLDGIIGRWVSPDSTELLMTAISFVLVVAAVKILADLVLPMFKGINKVPVLGGINRIFGGLFGVGKCIIILWILVFLSVPYAEGHTDGMLYRAFEDSRMMPVLCEYNPLVDILEGEIF